MLLVVSGWRSTTRLVPGLNLLTLNDNTRAGAKAKPNKSNKRSRETCAVEDGPPSSSKSRRDPEAKKRLDQLKIDSEVVKMSQKWVGRIKTLNVEASQSLAAAEHYPELSAPLALNPQFESCQRRSLFARLICCSHSEVEQRGWGCFGEVRA